jgi:hypothetical protein
MSNSRKEGNRITEPEDLGAPERQDMALAEAVTIRQCLTYLEAEANRLGLGVTAHLIGVAAESVRDLVARTKSNGFCAMEPSDKRAKP